MEPEHKQNRPILKRFVGWRTETFQDAQMLAAGLARMDPEEAAKEAPLSAVELQIRANQQRDWAFGEKHIQE